MAVDKTVVLICLFTKGFASVDLRDTPEVVNQTTEPMHTLASRSRPRDTTGQHFGDVLFHEVNKCNWTAVLILTSGGHVQLISHVADLFNAHAVSVVHYEVSKETNDSFQATVWHLYHQKQFTKIVWLGGIPESLMAVLNKLFDEECRSFGAMMPHDFQIVLVVSSDELQKAETLLEDSSFDNIAVFVTRRESLAVEEVYTLIWKPHRKRQLETVIQFRLDVILEGHMCSIFPNSYRGMNGRVLKGAVKQAVALLQITDGHKYHGYAINIINTLALYLNFTYVLEPDPKHESNTTWGHFRNALSQSKVDFGAALIAVNFAHYWNISVTYPAMFGNISGVFVLHKKNRLLKLKSFLIDEVHLICSGCLVFVVIMYALIERFIFRENKRNILRNLAVQVIPLEKSQKESDENPAPCESSTDYIELFFGLFGVMLNQDILPLPTNVSLRILMWSWRLVAFVVTTALTSTMTAYLINSFDDPEVSSVDEIIARGYYILGAGADTFTDLLMVDVGQDITAKQVFLSRGTLSKGYTRPLLSVNEVVSELESGNYVAFLFSPLVEMWYKKQLKNLVRLPESVMTANLGIPLPENSTLQKVFSDAIIKLTDCGFLEGMERMFRWRLDAGENEAGSDVHLPVDVASFFDYVFVCYYFLGVSTVTLIGEFVFIKIKTLIGKFRRQGNN